MKQAPLQLVNYRIHAFTFKGNPDFDQEAGHSFFSEGFSVDHEVEMVSELHTEKEGSSWAVRLEISQEKSEKSNIPYHYNLTLEGMVMVHPNVEDGLVKDIISSNGPALLYGVAREVIRNMTSLGAYMAITIPSTNFIPSHSE